MRILVYIDLLAGSPTSLSRELMAAALTLVGTGGSVDLAVIGNDGAAVTALGADRLFRINTPDLARYNPAAYAACADALVEQSKPDLILFGYCTAGLDIAPSIAVRHDIPLVSYCTGITVDGGVLATESQVYGGKMIAQSRVSLPAVLMVNPGVYREAEAVTGKSADIIDISPPADMDISGTAFLRATEPDPNAIDITKAERLLCVGRGIGDPNGVEEARAAATLIGAELVGSRPVVDAGWLPKERQVGKSGRKVKPRLYIALGVSGAPEHLEGMSSADTIVAINSDARAPIFDHAHFGATIDAADFIEALTEALEK